MAISSVWTNIRINRVKLLLHSREDLALDSHVGGQRKGCLSLQVFQDNIRLALHQLVAQDRLRHAEVDVVQLMMLERGLEATESFEDGQKLSRGVPNLDLFVLPLGKRLQSCSWVRVHRENVIVLYYRLRWGQLQS